LEFELEQPDLAEKLYSKSQEFSCKFQKTPLKYSKPTENCETNAKWKIIINETIDTIREALSFLGEPKIKQKAHNNTLIFRFDSEISPVVPIRLKVEINTREHFNVLELIYHDFRVSNQWFSGSCKTTTYQLEELLGTKLRALYQRRKGRDLFDLYKALSTQNLIVENILHCYHEYIGFVVDNPPTQKEYVQNMELKIRDGEFLDDTNLLLRLDDKYNPGEAWELVKNKLIIKL
jgi:hypothetical protein